MFTLDLTYYLFFPETQFIELTTFFLPGPNLPTAFVFPGTNLTSKGYLGPNLQSSKFLSTLTYSSLSTF